MTEESEPLSCADLVVYKNYYGAVEYYSPASHAARRLLATIAADRREIVEMKANHRNEIQRWRNDALEACAKICDQWGLDGHGPASDIRAMIRREKDTEFVFGERDAKDREIAELKAINERLDHDCSNRVGQLVMDCDAKDRETERLRKVVDALLKWRDAAGELKDVLDALDNQEERDD